MRLTPFNLTQNISVDNALSTIQVIHQIITKVNNVVDYVNNLEINANEYTDEKIKDLSDNLQIELTNLETLLKNYTDVSKKEVKDYTDGQIENVTTNLNNSISRVYTYIDDLEQSLRNYIDLNDNEIELLIYEIKDELINLINQGKEKVVSPVDGRTKSIQKALYDIFNLINIEKGNINIRNLNRFLNMNVFIAVDGNPIDVGPKTFTYGKSLNKFINMSDKSTLNIKKLNNDAIIRFTLFNRLDCAIKYSFFVLYYLAYNYITTEYPNENTNDILHALSSGIYGKLGYGYCDVINMIGWEY